MEWSSRVELAYRVRVKLGQDPEFLFNELVATLEDTWLGEAGRIEYGEVEDLYMQIGPHQVIECQEKGILITEFDGSPCFILRQMVITVKVEDEDFDVTILPTIFEATGKVYAAIRCTREALTEVPFV